jgi:predicted site-specific integrase-resolvase
MTDSNILTRRELADNLGVHPMTIKRWEKEGLPVMTISSKTKRYNYQEVITWMEERELAK